MGRRQVLALVALIVVVAVVAIAYARSSPAGRRFCTTGLAISMVNGQTVVLEDQGAPGRDGCELASLNGYEQYNVLAFNCTVHDHTGAVVASTTPNRIDGTCGQPDGAIVSGRFVRVGGQIGAGTVALPGVITATRSDGSKVVATVGPDGAFVFHLSPGTYALAGTSPMIQSGQGDCPREEPVIVRDETPQTADVTCYID